MKIFTLVMVGFLVACQNASTMTSFSEHSIQKQVLHPNHSIKQLHHIKLVYDTQRGLYQSQLGGLEFESPQWNALSLISEKGTLNHMLWEAEQRYQLLELRYQELRLGHNKDDITLPFGLAAHIQRLKNRQQLALRFRVENQVNFDALAYLMILKASTALYSDAIVFLLSE